MENVVTKLKCDPVISYSLYVMLDSGTTKTVSSTQSCPAASLGTQKSLYMSGNAFDKTLSS